MKQEDNSLESLTSTAHLLPMVFVTAGAPMKKTFAEVQNSWPKSTVNNGEISAPTFSLWQWAWSSHHEFERIHVEVKRRLSFSSQLNNTSANLASPPSLDYHIYIKATMLGVLFRDILSTET